MTDSAILREKLAARLVNIDTELFDVRKRIKLLETEESIAMGRRDEISFAIEQLDDLIFKPEPPTPAKPKRAYKKRTPNRASEVDSAAASPSASPGVPGAVPEHPERPAFLTRAKAAE